MIPVAKAQMHMHVHGSAKFQNANNYRSILIFTEHAGQAISSTVALLGIDWLLVIGIQISINRLSQGDKVCVGGSL